MLMRSLLVLTTISLLGGLSPEYAAAEIYKYIDKNGNVVYTDNLSALSSKRRRYYQKRKAEREQKLKALEKRLGKEEFDRRQTEKQKLELQRKNLNKSELKSRLAALNAQLKEYDTRKNARKAKIKKWQDLIDKARAQVESKVTAHKEATATFTRAAFQYSSTALLGHLQTRNKAAETMKRLETEIDEVLNEINVVIPKRAQAAGVSVRALH